MLKKFKKIMALTLAMVCFCSFTAGAVGLTQTGAVAYSDHCSRAIEMITSGNYAFVTVNDDKGHGAQSEIHIYDISNPQNISYVNNIWVSAGYQNVGLKIQSMHVFGNYLFFTVASNQNYGWAGLYFIMLSDISASGTIPVNKGYDAYNNAISMKATKDYLYTLEGNYTTKLFVIREDGTYDYAGKKDGGPVPNLFNSMVLDKDSNYGLMAEGEGYNVYEDANLYNLPAPVKKIAKPSTGHAIAEFKIYKNYLVAKTSGSPSYDHRLGLHFYDLNAEPDENGLIHETNSKTYYKEGVGGELNNIAQYGRLLAIHAKTHQCTQLIDMVTGNVYGQLEFTGGYDAYGATVAFNGNKLLISRQFYGLHIYDLDIGDIEMSKTVEYTYDENDELVATVTVINKALEDYTAKAYIAVYEGQKLVDVAISEEVTIPAGDPDYEIELPPVTDGNDIKIMLLNENYAPLCATVN